MTDAPAHGTGQRFTHGLAIATACGTFLLIIAGALVKSTGSSLAVPDWPLAFGKFFPKMEGGVLFEHSHRIVATGVGFLTTLLALALVRFEPRGWVRTVGIGALAAVVAQGLLGGASVLLRLPPVVTIGHAGLAQLFFALTITLAFITCGEWDARWTARRDEADGGLTLQCALTAALVYAQILLGALVRHLGAGLSIADFPLSMGQWIPPLDSVSVYVAIHFAHRVGALAVLVAIAAAVWRVARHAGRTRAMTRVAGALFAAVLLQVTLGAYVIWTERAVALTTAHVATGALTWGLAVMLTLVCWRDARRGIAVQQDNTPAPAGREGQASAAPACRAARAPSYAGDLLELTKARLTALVGVTALTGALLARPTVGQAGVVVAMLLGTLLLAAGGVAMNQVLEADADARMERTRHRPVAAGRLSRAHATAVAQALAIAGLAILVLGCNALTAALGIASYVIYISVYTPLKRTTSLCTVVGAVPGALPPVMGWTAVAGGTDVGVPAAILFAILYFWQLPHFLALAWMRRDDYARGGFVMLSALDESGDVLARQVALYSVALLPASLLPTVLGYAGTRYFATALLLGTGMVAAGARLVTRRSLSSARTLFATSLVYLPVLLSALVLDQVVP